MTLDDLIAVFEKARAEAAPFPQHHEDGLYAGVLAIVRALRDEIVPPTKSRAASSTMLTRHVRDVFNEILGDAGEKVADYTCNGVRVFITQDPPATDAAPAVCVWTVDRDPDGEGHYETQCQNGWTLLHGKPALDGYSFCPSCGKPIKFAAGDGR